MTNPDTLFQPLQINQDTSLANRIVMAPLTRCMADEHLVPTQAMADYYGKRAKAGLIISEATLISKDGQGYPNTPGLYSEAQIQGWHQVTQQVHDNGGKIFAQIWHTGRVSHSIYHNGSLPVAPSAIAVADGHVARTNLSYEVPRALSVEEIRRIQQDFVTAAQNAIAAGFDGIEIHGANGYMIDQFLHWSSNQRLDQYGGNYENMSRFLFEILDAIGVQLPLEKVGLRLSPRAYVVMEHDDRDKSVFDYLLNRLNDYPLAYVHTGIFQDDPIEQLEGNVTQYIRKHYKGRVIANGSYNAQSASEAIERGDCDLVAIGRPFIANADYVQKVRQQLPLIEYHDSMLETLD